MALINDNFLKLPGSSYCPDITKKANAFKLVHPNAKIINLGNSDVSLPLSKEVIHAMLKATEEMSQAVSFKGYGPEQGYRFLIDKIIKFDYESRKISLDPDEVFISNGSKSDIANFGEILSKDNRIAVMDLAFPVYVDSNVIGCRAGEPGSDGRWNNIYYIPCTSDTDFIPELPLQKVDIVYLCFPNNPTGAALNKSQLKVWVDYAIKNNVLILFDAAYEAFITDSNVPHSIYEIKGAKKVAVEFKSFSKSAGFTGARCGYTVVPKELIAFSKMDGTPVMLNELWKRRQLTKFNGTPYIIQKAVEAIYSPKGREEVNQLVEYYKTNARYLRESLEGVGLKVFGGINSPFVWFKAPNGLSSWKMFERLLYEVNITGTPGVKFGPGGEGYIRLSALNDQNEIIEVKERLSKWKP
ncbi:MAG: LL-diaminopimelate aminotransferase [Bacteroidales bacterium]|nr:LL-diaminopimelate aminotransferase [Bacteroidales bacterium]